MTRPAAAAFTGVPVGAAISIPVCGERGSLLKMRRIPYELERMPGIGCSKRNVSGGESVNVEIVALLWGVSRPTLASSSGERSTLLGATFNDCVTYFLSTMLNDTVFS